MWWTGQWEEQLRGEIEVVTETQETALAPDWEAAGLSETPLNRQEEDINWSVAA